MKIAIFNDERVGVVQDDLIVDVTDVLDLKVHGQQALEEVMRTWESTRAQLQTWLPSQSGAALSSVNLCAPVPWPSKIICAASNYREGTDMPPRPLRAFVAPPTAILGPGGTLELPPHEIRVFQHEAELVCVVGKTMKNVAMDDALNYVFGYTAGVDVSPRTEYWGFLPKSFDGHKPIGPWIVTSDEIEDPGTLQVQLSVDGVLRQDYNTKDMGHPVAECLAWLSTFMTLLPGDLLFLGTNHQQLGPLQDGELVSMTIEKVGSFEFNVSDPLKRTWPKNLDAGIAAHARERLRENAAGATG